MNLPTDGTCWFTATHMGGTSYLVWELGCVTRKIVIIRFNVDLHYKGLGKDAGHLSITATETSACGTFQD